MADAVIAEPGADGATYRAHDHANDRAHAHDRAKDRATDFAADALPGLGHVPLRFELNGRMVERQVPAERLLCDLLRDDLGLKGTKVGCARGACGACVTLIDGRPQASCSTFAFQVHDCRVTSIEGLEQGGALHPIQQAFVERSAFQCGYCTAGMVLLTKALLDAHPDPDRATIVEWISSNICRCTGYALIIEAVQDAARRLRLEQAP